MNEKKYSGEMNNTSIQDYFLFNNNEQGEKKYRLILTKSDKETLKSILEGRETPSNPSKTIIENFNFFWTRLESLR
jgi:hypothetical protein